MSPLLCQLSYAAEHVIILPYPVKSRDGTLPCLLPEIFSAQMAVPPLACFVRAVSLLSRTDQGSNAGC